MAETVKRRKAPSGSEDEELISSEEEELIPGENETHNNKQSKLRQCITTLTEMSNLEWMVLFLVPLLFADAVVLSIRMFMNEKTDSAYFIFAIVLVITSAFLLVYPVYGVLKKMPYSLLLHCLCNVVLMAYCIVYYILSEDRTFEFVILIVGAAASAVDMLCDLYLGRKYWRARTMGFPFGALSDYQGTGLLACMKEGRNCVSVDKDSSAKGHLQTRFNFLGLKSKQSNSTLSQQPEHDAWDFTDDELLNLSV